MSRSSERWRSYRPMKTKGGVFARSQAALDAASRRRIRIFAVKAAADFVTVYNFYGLVDGSAKVPAGWEFSSETSGRTPAMGGYPLVLPLDVPDTPNLTWTVTKPVAGGG
jgi:hypothetical protein